MRATASFALVAGLLALGTACAWADEIPLLDGHVIHGRVVSTSGD